MFLNGVVGNDEEFNVLINGVFGTEEVGPTVSCCGDGVNEEEDICVRSPVVAGGGTAADGAGPCV